MSLAWKIYWSSILFMFFFYEIKDIIPVAIVITIMAYLLSYPFSFAVFLVNICLLGPMNFTLFALFRSFFIICIFIGEQIYLDNQKFQKRIEDAPFSESEADDDNYHTVDDIKES